MIEIDGIIGGGQILRTSLSLSALTGKSFKIINIRGKKESSGLLQQHLTAVKAISKICNAKVTGAEFRSHELEFTPSKVVSGNYQFDIGTAGSTTLVIQTVLPALIFSDDKTVLDILGGTANPLAPPALDIKNVFLWYLKKIGVNAELKILKEGFYPKGGGHIKVIINPCKELKEIKLSDVSSNKINVFAVSSSSLKDKNVCSKLIQGFKTFIPREYILNTNESYVETLCSGCYIHANYETQDFKLGFTVLGEKTIRSEDIGKECALELLKEIKSKSTVDRFTADQLLIFMALKGSGSIKVLEISNHIRTNIETIEKFIDVKFTISDNNIISCKKI